MIRKFFNKRRVISWIVFFVVFIPAYMLAMRYDDIKKERRREAELHQYKEKVKTEVLRRQSEKEKSDTGSETERVADTPADSVNPSENTEPTQAQNGTDPPIAPIAEGPFKGMTYIEAQKLPEWHARSRELSKKMGENVKKVLAQTDALLKPKKERLPAILSVFPMLSPEQLKYARENALNSMPAEDVEFLFNALAEISNTKTAEQVAEDVKGIITYRQAYDIINWELDVESEQIQQGRIKLYGAEEWERQLEEARVRNEKN
ncbi:hypothetical protein C6496_13935 [Candidatus Poribacteria bacterium]|nr:MAG: hypothetical protein C6496_13935 [Candidatus Poribacteria bacterium]